MENSEETLDLCPCGSGKTFDECCAPYLTGETKPATAEALMRARYTAFTVSEIDFLYKTSGPRLQKQFDEKSAREWAKSAKWEGGIDFLRCEGGSENDEEAVIEFIAHYKTSKDAPIEHHELAQFRKINGDWRFIDGDLIGPEPQRRETPKVGRNDPCPCGSGKKFKKCCGVNAN